MSVSGIVKGKAFGARLTKCLAASVLVCLAACSGGAQNDSELAALRAEVTELSARLLRQEDGQKLRTLAFSYAYFVDNALYDEALSLFSDEHTESCEIGGYGVFKGKEGCVKLYKDFIGKYYGGDKNMMEFGRLAKHYMAKDIITISDDGLGATGRFDYFSFGATFGVPDSAGHQVGVYTLSFVKENGIWKISKLWVTFKATSFDKPGFETQPTTRCYNDEFTPDAPTTFYHPFPESAVIPFHFPNPVTGKPVTEYKNPQKYWNGYWEGDDPKAGCGPRAELGVE